ncbi:hypothetical protein CRYUN_Cryun12cG0117000 [Craigia yunnanensis]
MDGQANSVPAIVVETIQSLNFCRREGKGDFIGCAQLLYIWIRSHFWGKCDMSIRFHMSNLVPIAEFCKKDWSRDQTREQWVAAFQSLDPAHITWKAPWMTLGYMLFGCGNKIWVPLLGLWGAVSYAPILVCRQFTSEQFVPSTHGFNQLEFDYRGSGYVIQLAELSILWTEPLRVEFSKHSYVVVPGYLEWKAIRAKDVMLFAMDDSILPADPLPKGCQLK